MATFVIFGAAVMAILFFLLEVFFKILSSAFNALLSSIGLVLRIGIMAILSIIGLYLFYTTVDGIINNGFMSTLLNIALCAVFIAVVILFAGNLGALIISAVIVVTDFILELMDTILEYISYIFESCYSKFMTVIDEYLKKC